MLVGLSRLWGWAWEEPLECHRKRGGGRGPARTQRAPWRGAESRSRTSPSGSLCAGVCVCVCVRACARRRPAWLVSSTEVFMHATLNAYLRAHSCAFACSFSIFKIMFH
eukprot:1159255-Pelagomonas_calceolata.AAC.5